MKKLIQSIDQMYIEAGQMGHSVMRNVLAEAKAELQENERVINILKGAIESISKAESSESGCYYINKANIAIAKKALEKVSK